MNRARVQSGSIEPFALLWYNGYMSRKIPDLVGKRYGKLVVIKLLSSKRDGSRIWLCQCDCGNTKEVTTRHLNRNPVTNKVIRSCGCLNHLKGPDSPHWNGVGEISGQWFCAHITRENSQTARVKVPVTVTKEYLWELFIKQERKCALSGIPIIIANGNKGTASVDRINNSLGYVFGNVQFVHKNINFMKGKFDQDYFVSMCKLIANNK